MANEEVIEKKEVETDKKVETDKNAPQDVKQEDVKVEKKEDVDNTAETEKEPVNEGGETADVQEVDGEPNGIRIEDLVTKEDLDARFSALEAKFEAVFKENSDLKDKLSGMEDKYENKDFGNNTKQGLQQQDKTANQSFEEYSRQFMK